MALMRLSGGHPDPRPAFYEISQFCHQISKQRQNALDAGLYYMSIPFDGSQIYDCLREWEALLQKMVGRGAEVMRAMKNLVEGKLEPTSQSSPPTMHSTSPSCPDPSISPAPNYNVMPYFPRHIPAIEPHSDRLTYASEYGHSGNDMLSGQRKDMNESETTYKSIEMNVSSGPVTPSYGISPPSFPLMDINSSNQDAFDGTSPRDPVTPSAGISPPSFPLMDINSSNQDAFDRIPTRKSTAGSISPPTRAASQFTGKRSSPHQDLTSKYGHSGERSSMFTGPPRARSAFPHKNLRIVEDHNYAEIAVEDEDEVSLEVQHPHSTSTPQRNKKTLFPRGQSTMVDNNPADKIFNKANIFMGYELLIDCEKRYVCSSPACQRKFKARGSLTTHYNRVHALDKDSLRKTCTLCRRVYANSNTFQRHAKNCLEKNGPLPNERIFIHSSGKPLKKAHKW
ncbi:unnamed protein product [Caenorhabditis auriculariae]|uniref:C2H2-type domain-containing protein n=1 Tax=Caenorhabditis auriculariae TaxID=2777116 RepID=A0A8S1H2K4_9PELO|nr:unnamed protein product [Caenorhabditis auriculariae]